MQKKRVEELNVLDDFLFGSIVSYPEIGQEFCRCILSIILGREVRHVEIIPQRVYYGAEPGKHGARLDVYIEEDGSTHAEPSSIYDVEPDKNHGREDIASLPRRVRFYHAKIDGASLESGESYHGLKQVIVIMITTYDPFGRDRMVYTVKNCCVEEPGLPYEDGALTLYLYTKGTQGDPPEQLKSLLHYMEESQKENARDETLQKLHHMVEKVKHDKEVSLEYMKIFEREQMIREEGIKFGREAGIEAGMEIGRKEGERLLDLVSFLLRDKRPFDLAQLRADQKLREKLYKEYGL